MRHIGVFPSIIIFTVFEYFSNKFSLQFCGLPFKLTTLWKLHYCKIIQNSNNITKQQNTENKSHNINKLLDLYLWLLTCQREEAIVFVYEPWFEGLAVINCNKWQSAIFTTTNHKKFVGITFKSSLDIFKSANYKHIPIFRLIYSSFYTWNAGS